MEDVLFYIVNGAFNLVMQALIDHDPLACAVIAAILGSPIVALVTLIALAEWRSLRSTPTTRTQIKGRTRT